MARKLQPSSRAELAKARGFVACTRPEASSRKINDSTLTSRERSLATWHEFLEACDNDKETALTVDLAKNFLHWYEAGTAGRLADKPTVITVYHLWSDVANWFQWKKVEQANYREVVDYIMNDMELTRARRPRYLVSSNDIDNLLRQLWQNDAFEYPYPVSRVQVALWLCLQAYSGQRGGTFSESSARKATNESLWYKDTILYLGREDSGRVSLQLLIGVRFRKGLRLHAKEFNWTELPTLVFIENDEPFRCVVLYFLAKALADKAFKHVQTIDDILSIRLREGQNMHVFEWRDDIADMPVLHNVEDRTKSLTYDTITCQVNELGRRAGYRHPITMHGIRRNFLNAANRNYTSAERNMVASHSGKLFEEAYQSKVSRVDGYALLTDKKLDQKHASIWHSMEFSHQKDAPHIMPASLRAELHSQPKYIEIEKELEELCARKDQYEDKKKFEADKNVIYRRRKRMYAADFTKYKDERDFYKSEAAGHKTSKFSILRPFMPERDRLADALFEKATICSATGQQILKDLVKMASSGDLSNQPLYRDGERPVEGKCPSCGILVDSLRLSSRASHIHTCLKRKLKTRKKGAFAAYCHICNEWKTEKQVFIQDQMLHAEDPPVFCGMLQYRSLLIRPGYCPFCFGTCEGNGGFRTYERNSRLRHHMKMHLDELEGDQKKFCPHPKCKLQVESTLDEHFETVHFIPAGHRQNPKSKRHLYTDSTEHPRRKRARTEYKADMEEKGSSNTPVVDHKECDDMQLPSSSELDESHDTADLLLFEPWLAEFPSSEFDFEDLVDDMWTW